MLKAILLSSIAGILGTGLGGIMGLLFLQGSKRALSYLMAFAAGVMAGVAAFELIPEALLTLSVWEAMLGVGAGAVLVMMLQFPIDHACRAQKSSHRDRSGGLMRSGFLMFAAIGLHNLPEGLAIGAGSGYDFKMGVSLALLIALHDVPEGMSVAVPLHAGGIGKAKAVLLTALSGLPTLIGGVLGFLFGGLSARAVTFSLAGAGGAMLYVTFCELLPEATELDTGRKSTLLTLLGVMVGLAAVMLA